MWSINGLMWDDITEFPVFGSTEIWTWHNQSGISHPMHMHLVAFQILDRQAINEATGQPEGPILPPGASEKGWKDTANSPPGFVTRVIVRFDGFTGLYPYHCHILEHEDHEMMRQFEVVPCQLVSKTIGTGPGSLRYALDCAENGDTLFFASTLEGDTLVLMDSILIDKDIVFLNSNTGAVIINGQNTMCPFRRASGHTVEFTNLHILSGTGGQGRGITNQGNLTLNHVHLLDSTGGMPGGYLMVNHGLLTLKNNCSFLFSPF